MKYTKMHGAGNDFIVINNLVERIPTDKFSEIASKLCSRRTSIGADGIMFVDISDGSGNYRMYFYNSDGTEGEMCGNGARCICRYGYENNLANEYQKVETKAGFVEGWKIDKRNYRIKLNSPTLFEEEKVLDLNGKTYSCAYVELGNPGLPHLIVDFPYFDQIKEEELFNIGKSLRIHESLKNGANVSFYRIDNNDNIRAKTFERGVEDFTLACGTGAGSIVYTLYKKGVIKNNKATIIMPGGTLKIEVAVSRDESNFYEDIIYLTGPTNMVSEGVVLDEDLIL
jgi:diaminopimelate epimerase